MLEGQIKILIQFLIASYEMGDKKPQEFESSLTFFRLISYYKQFKWIGDCISQNAYHQVIRELRFILDSIIQAYYVDKRHPASDMQCKLEIVKEIEYLYGSDLIDKTDLSHKHHLKKLYGELCKYVHSSYKELLSSRPKDPKKIAGLEFEPDPDMMKLCLSFVNRTIDVVFFVVLSLYPEILGPDTRFGKIRTSFPQSSKKLGFELTLSKWIR